MLALICFLGGPIVNKLGTKWSLVIGALSFPIQGSSYYVNSKYGNQWVSVQESKFHFKKGCRELIKRNPIVPHFRWVHLWNRYRVLVCRRGWIHHVSRSFWCSRKILGSLDCLSESGAASRRCNQVSSLNSVQSGVLIFFTAYRKISRRGQRGA